MTIKKFTCYQAYLAKFLSKLNFLIFYILSKDNTKINLLL